MASAQIIIIGARGHARSLAESAASAGYQVSAFIDEVNTVRLNEHWHGIPIFDSLGDLGDLTGKVIAVGIGDNEGRRAVFLKLRKLGLQDDRFPTIIHSSANVSRFASMGLGAQALQGACVGSGVTIEKLGVVNTNASIDHDSYLGAFSRINPGAVVAGGVRIGEGTTIGMNASIMEGVRIGNDVTIGANSFVNQDIPDGVRAFGIPAKIFP